MPAGTLRKALAQNRIKSSHAKLRPCCILANHCCKAEAHQKKTSCECQTLQFFQQTDVLHKHTCTCPCVVFNPRTFSLYIIQLTPKATFVCYCDAIPKFLLTESVHRLAAHKVVLPFSQQAPCLHQTLRCHTCFSGLAQFCQECCLTGKKVEFSSCTFGANAVAEITGALRPTSRPTHVRHEFDIEVLMR